ncbi:glycosyl hydrolase family 18 protein [Streptomyces celluloflavus]|uniref:chitinase n=1 Tax=Streptomyces celluloflavus TaxID=58344 RepID=A0ABW7RFY8_9ACTN
MHSACHRLRRALLGTATALLATAATVLGPGTGPAVAKEHTASSPHRVVAYYQTQYTTGSNGSKTYVSPLPLKGIATDVEVAALHLNDDGSVHLNDNPPADPMFDQVWRDVATLQASGTRVSVMLGGAAQGTYANLHRDFTKYYGLLRDTLRTYRLDGVDIDIEETFSLADTEHLIAQLRTDFGPDFVISLAPVASDLSGSTNFSGGFDYATLEQQAGNQISWYNAQFYCGWGSLTGTRDYDAIMNNGFRPAKVVTGAVTNPATCGGYVDPTTLASTVGSLTAAHPDFGGVAGWEYFNAVGVGGGPETWYAHVKGAMG